jgi:hypothetical protein
MIFPSVDSDGCTTELYGGWVSSEKRVPSHLHPSTHPTGDNDTKHGMTTAPTTQAHRRLASTLDKKSPNAIVLPQRPGLLPPVSNRPDSRRIWPLRSARTRETVMQLATVGEECIGKFQGCKATTVVWGETTTNRIGLPRVDIQGCSNTRARDGDCNHRDKTTTQSFERYAVALVWQGCDDVGHSGS